MRMFLKPRGVESRYGSDLASVECRNVKLQLANKEILIGKSALNSPRDLTPDQQKRALLGMQLFFGTTTLR